MSELVKSRKANKKVVSTRLTDDEVRFLQNLGKGDLSAGVRIAIERAGYKVSKEMHRGYRVVREIVNQGAEKGRRFSLYLNNELAGLPLTISDSILKALVERFGKSHVMREIIIKSFVGLPKEVEIDRIYDFDERVAWDKYAD